MPTPDSPTLVKPQGNRRRRVLSYSVAIATLVGLLYLLFLPFS